MSRIQPISTTRVTDSITRDRLTNQVQATQLELFRIQDQILTGRQFQLPSDDPAAAQRSSVLQRTIERKDQSLSNLEGAVATLTNTEAALAGVASSLNEIRADALGVVDTVATDEQRTAIANIIDGLLIELTRVGNANFASNFLLGGSERTNQAYANAGEYIDYFGNESAVQTFIDIGEVFDVGVSGDDVLGGLSEAVRGTADLNPQLTLNTGLDQLNGGFGIGSNGAIEVRYVPSTAGQPAVATVVDLSTAKTVEDVARLIEDATPDDAGIAVEIQDNGLRVLPADGAITIAEIGEGDTAQRLGILSDGAAVAVVNGADLDPTLRITTRLDDLVGAKTTGRIVSAGADNDLVLRANANGASLNGVTVDFVDGAVAGAEVATYTGPPTNTLAVSVATGQTTAAQVATAINAIPGGPFTAEVDYRDQTNLTTRGAGEVSAGTNLGVGLAGGRDGAIDLASGLLITNGDAPVAVDTSAVETVEDLLNLLNDPDLGLSASINAASDGLDIRSRRSGVDFTIAENGGTTATDLGIRTYTASSSLADFNRDVGVILPQGTETETRVQNTFEITVTDQGVTTTYDIDPLGLSTVQDVIDEVAAATGGAVVASLATTGNGLVLTRADVIDGANAATVDVPLAGDTLTFTATAPGQAGNASYQLVVQDSAAGGLSTTLDATTNTITVDLGGATPGTDAVAASIQAALTGYTVTSTPAGGSPASVTTPSGPTSVAIAGGFEADTFSVTGSVAERLGFLPDGADSATSTTGTISSTDRNTTEVDSVFTTLIRMRDALRANDLEGLGEEINRLDGDLNRLLLGRAEVGSRLNVLSDVRTRLEEEDVTLQQALSQQFDVDLTEAISDFTQQQYALQAALQTAGQLLNLSILDFI